MNLVLNEYEWAKEMVVNNSLGDKPFDTLCRVAKYYMHDGFKGVDLKILMNSFLLRCDPHVSVPKWEKTVDRAITKAKKYGIVIIDEIVITKPEMEKINTLDRKQSRRVAFALLCIAKYYGKINPKSDGWVNVPDSDVMSIANVNTSIKRQSAIYKEMNDLGMIQFSKKVDNTNVRVCFCEEGSAAVKITDMRNLGYQYSMAVGEKGIMVCQNCGITTKYKESERGRRPKYCTCCAAEIKLRKTVECVMKRRSISS